MFKRQRRLKEEATKAEEDLSEEEQSELNQLKKHGYMIGMRYNTDSNCS